MNTELPICLEKTNEISYKEADVNIDKVNNFLTNIFPLFYSTFKNVKNKKIDNLGYFCNVIKLNKKSAISITTDGVGTKVLIAQAMNKYREVGIDCIAMNVNDIICNGSTPSVFVDYIACEEIQESLLNDLSKGLVEGANEAEIAIVGGETAQVRDLVKGVRPNFGFDISGTCMGLINPNNILDGSSVEDKDIIIGLESSGLHSNGFSLVRIVLFKEHKLNPNSYIAEFKKSLGEELLTPTKIYVKLCKELINKKIPNALINITGDGLLNILRIKNNVKIVIDNYQEPKNYIFDFIKKYSKISNSEMFRTFNMGIGFCIICGENKFEKVKKICAKYNINCDRIGYVEKLNDDKNNEIIIPKFNLYGKNRSFSDLKI